MSQKEKSYKLGLMACTSSNVVKGLKPEAAFFRAAFLSEAEVAPSIAVVNILWFVFPKKIKPFSFSFLDSSWGLRMEQIEIGLIP